MANTRGNAQEHDAGPGWGGCVAIGAGALGLGVIVGRYLFPKQRAVVPPSAGFDTSPSAGMVEGGGKLQFESGFATYDEYVATCGKDGSGCAPSRRPATPENLAIMELYGLIRAAFGREPLPLWVMVPIPRDPQRVAENAGMSVVIREVGVVSSPLAFREGANVPYPPQLRRQAVNTPVAPIYSLGSTNFETGEESFQGFAYAAFELPWYVTRVDLRDGRGVRQLDLTVGAWRTIGPGRGPSGVYGRVDYYRVVRPRLPLSLAAGPWVLSAGKR